MESDRTIPTRSTGLPVRALVATVVSGPDAGVAASADESLTIGTADGNDLVLTDRTISRYHVELRRSGDRIMVTDHASTNGTSVGPATFQGATVAIPAGTVISVGLTKLRVDDGDVRVVPVASRTSLGDLHGSSAVMRKLMGSVEQLAPKDVPLLLLGESGTGKELVARALHDLGARPTGPFVVVDCGAIAPSLFASELFGHEKGAFTGADRRHVGAFERASGGTILLDEIGELPPEQQVALLGVLERRRVRRVGGTQDVPVDVRVVAATHRDLRAKVNDGSFRLDLYYRLAVVLLRVPALRERPEDVPVLVEHFLREAGWDEPIEGVFSAESMRQLMSYSWPGNVRELRNVVSATLATGGPVSLDPGLAAATTMPPPAPAGAGAGSGDPVPATLELTYRDARARVLDDFERRYLDRLLERSQGNIREAARLGRMDRSHLMDLMRRHGMR